MRISDWSSDVCSSDLQAAAAAAGGHHDAVAVEETLVALAEPAEIAAVMAAFGAETHQAARQRAVAHGDAEIFGGVEEPAQPRGIEGQDGGAGGVVQGKDGIQLVLAHVADDNRHS